MTPDNNETLAENKVLILYILNITKQKPISGDSLFNIVNSATDLNYFYFQQYLLDLIKVEYVANIEKDGQVFYKITEKGQNTLSLTLDILPGILKLKVDTTLKSKIESIENQDSIVAEYTPMGGNKYAVNCRIVENGEIVFEIKTFCYSREQAGDIVQNWKENAVSIYPKLLELITTQNDN